MCCGINETVSGFNEKSSRRIYLLDQVYFLECQDVLWYK